MQQRLGWLAVAVLVLLSAWLLAQLVLLWLAPKPQMPEPQPVSVNASTESQINIAALQGLNLFGQPVSRSQQVNNAPRTQLNLRLLGVAASSERARSAAIIQQGNSQSTYVIGDNLGNSQVTIEDIFPDRVIINNGGRLETLALEGIIDGERPVTLDISAPAAAHDNSNSNTLQQVSVSANQQRIDDAEVNQQLADIRGNPGTLLDYVRIAPVQGPDGLAGYRLSPGRQPELFQQAGLQEGDIAVSINGYDLTDMAQAMAASNELQNSREATIEVLRGDERIELVFNVPAQ